MITHSSPTGWLVGMSFHISIVIAFFLPLRALLRRMIGSQWVCMLWLVILARLLMPWPAESRLGFFGGVIHRYTDSTESWKITTGPAAATDGKGEPAPAGVSSVAVSAPSSAMHMQDAAGIVWMAGLALGIGALAWRWMQTLRLARKTMPVTDARLLRIFDSIPHASRQSIALRMTSDMEVPAIAGVFHPQIWMPAGWPARFTDEELRNILLHELGHARRGDILVQWLFAFAQCIHWFNPLVWLAARAARLDREMACDAWVLARTGGHEDYGTALIKAVSLLHEPLRITPGAVAMASGARSFRARISGLAMFRPIPAWRGIAGLAIMFVALAAITTNRTAVAEDAAATDSPASAPSVTPSAIDSTPGAGDHLINVEAKFVEITDPAWQWLTEHNKVLHQFISKFPLPAKGTTFGTPPQVIPMNLEKGAWEVKNDSNIDRLALLSSDEVNSIMSDLDKNKGADLLSAPKVTTKSGMRAAIEIIREFRYPSAFAPDEKLPGKLLPSEFDTKDTGVTLEVESRWNKDGAIESLLTPTIADFLGFKKEKIDEKYDAVQRPVFSTSTGKETVTTKPGQTVLMGCVRFNRESADKDKIADAMFTPATTRHVVLIFVTVRQGTQKDASPSTTAESSPSPAGPDVPPEYPYGKPVPGKKGFVTSPFAPDEGQIDVRGFPRGTEVKDPYSGKIFFVP